MLATGADRAYPARSHQLHRRIAADGCVVSEFPPGHPPRRWQFPARNRLIAALSAGTVVIEGGERSGSLITADFAAELGRFVAAVPGPVTSRMSEGPLTLLKSGAELVRNATDVLDLLHGAETARGAAIIGGALGPARASAAATGPPAAPRRSAATGWRRVRRPASTSPPTSRSSSAAASSPASSAGGTSAPYAERA